MPTTITVHGDHATDVAEYLNSSLETAIFDRPGDCDPHTLSALESVIITQVDHADPNDPVNSEKMASLKAYSESCLACAYYHKLLDVVSRVGTADQHYALIQLIELHDLDCWGSSSDDDDD